MHGTPYRETDQVQTRHRNWHEATSQAFAVFLPIKTVGVMGDGQTYEWVVALRAVQTPDFMTAHWAHLPHDLLGAMFRIVLSTKYAG